MILAARWSPVVRIRGRNIAIALGFTALVHVGFFALVTFPTTQSIPRAAAWSPAYSVSLVRWPRPRRQAAAKTKPARRHEPTRSTDPATPNTTSAAPPILPALPATAPSAQAASRDAEADAAMRATLHGFAACHAYGVATTDKERKACEDRLGRLAADAPPIHKAMPIPADAETPQKAGTCRFHARDLLSPHVKCKFW
jgi:hypothetical protein